MVGTVDDITTERRDVMKKLRRAALDDFHPLEVLGLRRELVDDLIALGWAEQGQCTGQFASVHGRPGYRLTHVGHVMVDMRA